MIKKQPYKTLELRLTQYCNYNCSWCNQRTDLDKPMYDMSDGRRIVFTKKRRNGDEWIKGLNEYPYKKGYIELIFSGGEPSLHPDFFDIVTKVKGFRSKKIVTNLTFDVTKLIEECKRNKTSVIVQPSFHFEEADFNEFLYKMKLLDLNSLLSKVRPCSIVDLPDRDEPKIFRDKFLKNGYNAAIYDFEGYYKGKFYSGDIKGFGMRKTKGDVLCIALVNLVKPNGDVMFCVTDAYLNKAVIYGNICDKQYVHVPSAIACKRYGKCHISCAAHTLIKQADSLETIWKGDSYVEINLFCHVVKNILRPLFKNKCFNIKEYIKYIELHFYSW